MPVPWEATTSYGRGTVRGPEAVLAAAGIKCLGGDMQCKLWPRDEKERKSLIDGGYKKDLDRVFSADDLANGQNIQTAALSVVGKRAVQLARGQATLLKPALRFPRRSV